MSVVRKLKQAPLSPSPLSILGKAGGGGAPALSLLGFLLLEVTLRGSQFPWKQAAL